MNIEALADVLKSRECEAVCYFHTDHFEPWSSDIDVTAARAVERMAEMARSSPYARRLSLFYSVFVPYRLVSVRARDDGDICVPDDGVAFSARSARQEELAREAIRPLVAADAHEMHLHVHHEFWTRNTSAFDHPVSRWVNANSTVELDRARLDLHFGLCTAAIAREIGAPFERWGFIHGNWALNASDPLICHVSDEIAIIMRHGGFGDFSFPAGRAYCDPKLESPFTCLPLDLPRAYDDSRADPRPIGAQTRILRPDRFLVWNSPIKSTYSSLDYYSAANRALLRTPERVVAAWLGKSVALGQKLFVKTHAHSMKWEYKIEEPGSVIPHCYPDVVTIFECLSRVCDRARIELQFRTVNEVVEHLADLDGGTRVPASAPRSLVVRPSPPAVGPSPTASPAAAVVGAVAGELAERHRQWMAGEGANSPEDELYRAKLTRNAALEPYEIAVATAIAARFPTDETRLFEIGAGWGGFAVVLARLGFEVLGFEGNVRRYAACRWHFDEEAQAHPALRDRLRLAPIGLFPEVLSAAALTDDRTNLCIATNITHSYSAEHQAEIIRAATEFDEVIIDLGRFGLARDSQAQRDALFQTLTEAGFVPVERLFSRDPYEYWRFHSGVRGSTARLLRSEISGKAPSAQPPPPIASATGSVYPFPLNGHTGLLFSVFGNRRLAACPVCRSSEIVSLWRMPATNLQRPIEVFGGYFNQLPTLTVPGTVFCFDFCRECESIFLNPVDPGQKEEYRTTAHYIRKMEDLVEWRGYEDVYDSFARWIPPNATVMIDAACGIGQYLHVARRRGTHRWRRLIGLELAEKYVEHMRAAGLEAHVFDIDSDDLLGIVEPDSVDFISFCEAFEHVERPLEAMRKLMAVLRRGGRLFFTAQRYGTDVQAAVRPGEPIYIGEKVIGDLPRSLDCRIANLTTSGMRYYLVLEK
jgi:2-polyprenyl-3-methyl-5-hydroxy-6-metoxy-1,4-benzoquinol methylase